MTHFAPRRRWTSSLPGVVLFGAVALASWHSCAVAAPQPASERRDIATGLSGNYLAGVVAAGRRDTGAAAEYFREALKRDPRNRALLEESFVSDLADGDLPRAFDNAQRAATADRTNALAQLTLAVRAIHQKEYAKARGFLSRTQTRGGATDLTLDLLRAWTLVGSGDVAGALKLVDGAGSAELPGYRNFYGGLVAQLGKRPQEALRRLGEAYKSEPSTLRVADAYARVLAAQGDRDGAVKVIEEWREKNPGQPFLNAVLDEVRAGRVPAPLVANPAQGAAEVLYGIGAAGAGANERVAAIIYTQLALYLSPEDDLIRVSLAEIYDRERQFARASELYGAINPASALRNRALIGRAAALERLEKTEDAITTLRTLLAEHPGDIEASETLGTIFRIQKNWEGAIEVFTGAIDRIVSPNVTHWNLFFGRAIAFERAKKWDLAEADFLKAMDLLPARPKTRLERVQRAQVLNYLAYSWVDMGKNIERSFEMLQEAVTLSPEDGAIVDSLGWAHYRLGRYDEAVRELEKALELRAGDATINDHLGDAYWKVGRRREAYFKWQHALASKPEADELPKIQRKLEAGLDAVEGENVAVDPGKPLEPGKPNGG